GSSSIALIDGEGALTYAKPDALVRRFANALLAAGVRPEERVAFIAPDTRWRSPHR
ncbi:MAG: AMP-binding protein, partial [Acidobacteria bacterium]|nr:AMP-binding protein [Acidobacteriota bacterium]